MATTTNNNRLRPLFFLVAVLCLCLTAALAKESDDDAMVTCGSVIKLTHWETGYMLSSEPKNLNSGSGQQVVTFVKNPGTHNTLWWVRPAHHSQEGEYHNETSCQLAEPIPCGTTIRLTHLETMKNLHSHGVKSPLTSQQEVSAYGEGDGKGDGGDNWIVECSGKYWVRSDPARMFHVDTTKYLGTSKKAEFNQQTCGSQCPIMGHLESFCRSSADSYSQMRVEQGVHLSK